MSARLVAFAGAALILAGCASPGVPITPEERERRCLNATTLLLIYQAARAEGSAVPGDTERAARAATETLLMLRCGVPAPPQD